MGPQHPRAKRGEIGLDLGKLRHRKRVYKLTRDRRGNFRFALSAQRDKM
jgi:hypothetical protein